MYTLASLTMERASEMPGHRFLFDDEYREGLSYAAFDVLSGKVYAYLKSHGIGKEDFVLINLPRSANQVIAMAGVGKAGAAFTITEAVFGADRIKFIQKDCNCKIEINTEAWDEIMALDPLTGCEEVSPHDAAFAIYTSGSSGTPKGVLHEYGNMDFDMRGGKLEGHPAFYFYDNFAHLFPLFYAGGIYTLFIALGVTNWSGRNYIVSNEVLRNPELLRDYILENRISAIALTPSLAHVVGEKIVPLLRIMAFGGEASNNIYFAHEGFTLFSVYSSSETGHGLGFFPMKKAYAHCPGGKVGLEEVRFHILDENGNELPQGESGEICVDNYYTRGYINLEEETKKVFRNGLIHMGDAGYIDENGDVVILGRLSEMVKISGYAVEPAEIEAVLCRELGLEWAGVRVFTDQGDHYIAAYFIEEMDFDTETLQNKLKDKLPEYMIPKFFMKIDEIPQTKTGKMNRKALPMPSKAAVLREYVAPENDFQKLLCEKMAKVLKLERIGIRDDFFLLGGDSLAAISVLSECGIPGLSIKDLYAGKTPEGIWRIHENKEPADPDDAIPDALHYPLTAEQKYITDYDMQIPGSSMYNLYTLLRWEKGTIDAAGFAAAASKVIRAHPSLLTVYEKEESGELMQCYQPENFEEITVESLSEEEFQKRKDALAYPFQTIGGRLYRAGMFETEASVYFFFDVHHSICDGSSLSFLYNEMEEVYRGAAPSKDHYYSIIKKRNALTHTKAYEKDHAYFEKRCDGMLHSSLHPAFDKDGDGSRKLGDLYFDLDTDTDTLKKQEEEYHISRNGFFIAVSLLALSAYNKADDCLITWVFNGRDSIEAMTSTGLFIRNLPVRLKLTDIMTVSDLFHEVNLQVRGGIEHSAYPYIDLQEITDAKETVYLLYQMDMKDIEKTSTTGVRQVDISAQDKLSQAIFDIEIMDDTDGLSVLFEYAADYYHESSIKAFGALFTDYTKKLSSASGDTKLSDLMRRSTASEA